MIALPLGLSTRDGWSTMGLSLKAKACISKLVLRCRCQSQNSCFHPSLLFTDVDRFKKHKQKKQTKLTSEDSQ